jgi:hypothetical protein
MDEFMTAMNRAAAFIAARREYYRAQVHKPMIRNGLISTIAFVDSQASTFVVPSVEYLLRVTDASPSSGSRAPGGWLRPIKTQKMEKVQTSETSLHSCHGHPPRCRGRLGLL